MDEEEIDIEGDYTSELAAPETTPLYFDNELPSTSVNLTPEYTQHPWLLDSGWANDYFVDEKSKATIEKMLLEEEGLLGDNKIVSPRLSTHAGGAAVVEPAAVTETVKSEEHLNHIEYEAILMDNDGVPTSDASFPNLLGATTTCVTTADSPHQVELVDISPPAITITQPSAPKPKKAKKQVKSGRTAPSARATKKPKIGRPRAQDLNTVICHSETVNISSKTEEDDEDVIIDIEADDDIEVAPPPTLIVDVKRGSNHHKSQNGDSNSVLSAVPKLEDTVSISPSSLLKEEQVEILPEELPSICENNESSVPVVKADEECDSRPDLLSLKYEEPSSDNESDEADQPEIKPDHWGVLTSRGNVVYLSNPEYEVNISPKTVTEEEQEIHSEFFDGRPGLKTEDRYLRIRNYIIDCWKSCRPKYLYKTAVREGLKNCGDVNCIGRIHSYLEQKGVINFGCELAQYNCKRDPNPFKKRSKLKVEKAILRSRSDSMTSRKRRVRSDNGVWINEKDLEGVTIEHGSLPKKTSTKASKKKRKISSDPFKLVPCRRFEIPNEPFRVEIDACAMVTMDIHSHLSKTEVIGLIGGDFHSTESVLQVRHAEPCRSISTGMQCDMDSVSQAQACEVIHGKGLQVVGWYHSHPSFTPDPSLRDLETQTQYQTWFAKGGCPFIGIIVNPFSTSARRFNSEVRCLQIQSENNEKIDTTNASLAPDILSLMEKVPYQFDFQVTTTCWNSDELMNQLTSLLDEYKNYSDRIDVDRRYLSGMDYTVKEKMIYSALDYVRDDLGSKSEELHSILSNVFSSLSEALS